MKKNYILFFDSGIGGLTTLAKTISLLKYDYLYFADDKHCPYGAHNKQEILNYLTTIISSILTKYNIKFVVIACNTATASAIDELRILFKNIIFIGTEPAINLALKKGFKKILSLTTPLTSTLNRYAFLCQKATTKVKTISIKNLVYNIENYKFNSTLKNKFILLKNVATICRQSKNHDCIVLGCTHYVFLKPLIKQFCNLPLIDGNLGVTKNLVSHLYTQSIKKHNKTSVNIQLSSKNKVLKKKYKKILSQTLANSDILC